MDFVEGNLSWELDRKKRFREQFELMAHTLWEFITAKETQGKMICYDGNDTLENPSVIDILDLDEKWLATYLEAGIDITFIPYDLSDRQFRNMLRTFPASGDDEYYFDRNASFRNSTDLNLDTFITNEGLDRYIDLMISNELLPIVKGEMTKGYGSVSGYDSKTIKEMQLPNENVVVNVVLHRNTTIHIVIREFISWYFVESVLDNSFDTASPTDLEEVCLLQAGFDMGKILKMKPQERSDEFEVFKVKKFIELFNQELGLSLEYNEFQKMLFDKLALTQMEYVLRIAKSMKSIGKKLVIKVSQSEIDLLRNLIETKINLKEDPEMEIRVLNEIYYGDAKEYKILFN